MVDHSLFLLCWQLRLSILNWGISFVSFPWAWKGSWPRQREVWCVSSRALFVLLYWAHLLLWVTHQLIYLQRRNQKLLHLRHECVLFCYFLLFLLNQFLVDLIVHLLVPRRVSGVLDSCLGVDSAHLILLRRTEAYNVGVEIGETPNVLYQLLVRWGEDCWAHEICHALRVLIIQTLFEARRTSIVA